MEKKLITPPEILCKKMPMEFSYYFHYCRNLKFEDRPDYNMLKNLFLELLNSRISLKDEIVFDWFDEDNSYKEKKRIELNLSESGRIGDYKDDKKNKNEMNLIEENIKEEKEESKEESNINNEINKSKSLGKHNDTKENLIEEHSKEKNESEKASEK